MPVEQKFAAFMNSLTPEEQRAVVPLMATFASTISGPGEPPPPPPGAAEPAPGKPMAPAAAPPPMPGGAMPPAPGPEEAPMAIGRQLYS